MVKVYDEAAVIEHRKAKLGKISRHMVFEGKRTGIFSKKPWKTFTHENKPDEGDAEARLAALEDMRATMQANTPSAETLEDFFGKFFIEVTRRAQEAADLTSFIAREVVDPSMNESPTLRSLLPFRGQMLEVDGSNDPVPLIEQKTGALGNVDIKIWAVGWKDTLHNLLFNEFWTMSKVVDAAVAAYTDRRNALTVGAVVGATYDASQTQAAVSTPANQTFDEYTYFTLRDAIQKIWDLKDPQTNRKIGRRPLTLLINSSDSWQVERVVNGQLEANGGGARGNVVAALPIARIIQYDQGINDGFTVGLTTMSFPGVAAGTFYLFVPDIAIVAVKASLTMETGTGSPLQLSTEERAWYMAQGESFKDFLGSSYPATSLGSGFGFVVKGSLP